MKLRRILSSAALAVLAAFPAAAQVTAINSNGAANTTDAANWPAGTWRYGAVVLDAGLTPVGSLVEATGITYPLGSTGSIFPIALTVTLAAPAPAGQRIRVYRSKSGSILPGAVDQSYADFACPCASGTLGATGDLPNSAFFGPLFALTNSGVGNAPIWNWPSAGTWNARGILLDAGLAAVGQLASGFTFPAGATYPGGVYLDLGGSLPAGYRIRIYRSLSPISPGQTGLDYADVICPCNRGPYSGSAISGVLPNGDFTTGGTVVPVELSRFGAE